MAQANCARVRGRGPDGYGPGERGNAPRATEYGPRGDRRGHAGVVQSTPHAYRRLGEAWTSSLGMPGGENGEYRGDLTVLYGGELIKSVRFCEVFMGKQAILRQLTGYFTE